MNGAQDILIGKTPTHQLKQPLADETAEDGADGQRDAHAQPEFHTVVSGADQGNNRHSQYGTSGTETGCADREQAQQIHDRLDDHAAAGANNRANGGGHEANHSQYKIKHLFSMSFFCWFLSQATATGDFIAAASRTDGSPEFPARWAEPGSHRPGWWSGCPQHWQNRRPQQAPCCAAPPAFVP